MTQPNDTAISAYARVFSATGEAPTSAKSIATATGLPYSTVTGELKRLEENGQVVKSKDGSRTMWTRATDADRAADAAAGNEHAAVDSATDAPADVEPADVETIDATPLPALHNIANWQTGKRAELVEYAAWLGIATNPKNTKPQVIELIAQRLAEKAQAERDAARPDFAGMNVKSLREQAKLLKVPGTVSKMPRADLIAACDAAWDAAQDAAENAPTDAAADAAEVDAIEASVADAESAVETPAPVDGPWGTGDASGAPSGSMDAVLADMQAARPVSAPPAQVAAPRRAASGRPAGGLVTSGAAPAWGRGQCEATLLAMMQVLPDASHSATSLVKTYNEKRADGQPIMQAGSVAFALDVMVKKGTARLTQDKPKRYAAAVVPIPSA